MNCLVSVAASYGNSFSLNSKIFGHEMENTSLKSVRKKKERGKRKGGREEGREGGRGRTRKSRE